MCLWVVSHTIYGADVPVTALLLSAQQMWLQQPEHQQGIPKPGFVWLPYIPLYLLLFCVQLVYKQHSGGRCTAAADSDSCGGAHCIHVGAAST